MSYWSRVKSYFTPKKPSPSTVTQTVRDRGIVGTPGTIPSGITVTTTPPSGGGATYTGGGGVGRTTLSPLGQIAQERGIIGTPAPIPGITPSPGTPISPGIQTFQGTIPTRTGIYAVGELGDPTFQKPTAGVFFLGLGGRAKTVARGEAGFGHLFDPLRGMGRAKYFDPVSEKDIRTFEATRPFETGLRGTIQDQPLLSISGLTYGEFQTFKEVEAGMDLGLAGLRPEVKVLKLSERIAKEESKSIIGEYQRKIDIGEIPFEGTQEKAEAEFQERYGQRFETEFKVLEGQIGKTRISGLGVTPGTRIAETGEFALKTGAFIGAFASGSPALVGAASSVLIGTGQRDISKGILGTQFTTKERIGLITGGTISAGFGLYGVRISAGTQPSSLLARQSQREFLRELERQPATLGGRELARGTEGSLFRISGSKVTSGGRAVQEFDILAPTFRVGEAGLPRITGGKVKVRTTIQDVISDIPITVKEKFIVGGRITRAGETLRTGIGKIETGIIDIPTAGGRGFIQRRGQESFREFIITGAARREGDVLKVIGIKPTKAFLPLDKSPLKIRGRLEGAGRIELMPEAADTVRIFTRTGGKKTPFSKTFGEQIQLQVTGAELLPGITKQVTQEATRGAGQILKQQTRIVPATTLTQDIKQQTRQYQSLTPALSQQLFPRQMETQRVLGLTGGATIFRTGLRERQAVLQSQITSQKLRQDLRLTTPIILSSATISPYFTPPFRTGFPPILPPMPLFLKGRPGVGKELTGDFYSRYAASLTARAFDLKGVVSEKALKTGVVTPFQRRYIPTKRKPKARARSQSIQQRRRRRRLFDWY